MAKLKLISSTLAKIKAADISEGAIYAATDEAVLAYDFDGKRYYLTGEEATAALDGLMSASDKEKLDGITIINNTADKDKSVKYADSAGAVAWGNVEGKPNTYAPSAHNHDDRYYTETEIDTKLDDKTTEINTGLAKKSDTGHTHDDRYYTEAEIDTKLKSVDDTLTTINDTLPTKVDLSTSGMNIAINKLETGTSTPVDDDYYISQYVNGGTTTTTYHRRPMSALWSYVKGKADTVYQPKGSYAASSHTHTIANVTNLQNSLDSKAALSHTHAASDITSVNASAITGVIDAANLPSFVDDVLEYSGKANFPATGESGKIYVDTATNLTYRWSGSAYVEISPSIALGETSSTAYRGDRGAAAYAHSQLTSGNPHNVTATDLGLGNVENKSSATIRGELTKTNVTTALGYTPPTTNTTYSTGTSTAAGLTKLYTETGTGTDGTMTQSAITTALSGKAASSHTHNYAGSASAGGSATSAVKLDSSAGSATQPVYFSSGKPVATTYTLAASVPAGAVFTDTHYASKNVVGTTTATANTTTALTNGNVYLNSVENGAVTSTHKISGSGATTVTTDTSGNIVINSTNSTYTALKNPNAITISLNGTSQGAYDGSAAKTINITPSSIGAMVDKTSSELYEDIKSYVQAEIDSTIGTALSASY